MSVAARNQGPLVGVRVLDFSTALAGPWAAGVLADEGADVIKIERPDGGDLARRSGTQHKGFSAMFQLANRGKRSIAIDLATKEGRALALDLARSADVVVQNYRPGVAKKLGLDYEDFRAVNEGIIFASVTGFGPDGPYAGRRAFDSVIQAYSGLTAVMPGEGGEPQLIGHAEIDKASSLAAAQAITAALFARERGRGGQRIDLALLDVAVAFLWTDSAGTSTLLDADPKAGASVVSGRRCIPFADHWTVISISTANDLAAIARILGIDMAPFEELTRQGGLGRRRDLLAQFMGKMREASSTRMFSEVSKELDRADVPYAIAHPIAAVADDPQIRHNRLFVESIHPVAGRIREPRFPANFSGTPATISGPSPSLDEHREELLAELHRSR